MPGATFSILPEGGSTISFSTMDTGSFSTRNALYSTAGAPDYEYTVYHIPGTDGNAVCNLGEAGGTVSLTGVYIGTYPDIIQLYEDDKIAIAGKPCTVTDCAGYVHERCRLNAKASRASTPPKGTILSDSPAAFFIVEWVFDRNGTVTAP